MVKTCKLLLFCSFILNLTHRVFAAPDNTWQKIPAGVNASETRAILPLNETIFLIGTNKSLYKYNRESNSLRAVVYSLGMESAVNRLYRFENGIYAATDAGLFQSKDEGETFQKIFSGTDFLSRSCLCALQSGDLIFVGTKRGLFYKKINDDIWREDQGSLRNKSIQAIEQSGDIAWIATDSKIYRRDLENQEVREIFSLMEQESEINPDVIRDEEETVSTIAQIKDLKILIKNDASAEIYLATIHGIWLSRDFGEQWQKISSDGLPVSEMISLLISTPNTLWAATTKGVFVLENEKWISVYRGMETNLVYSLVQTALGDLYSGTDKGIFRLSADAISLRGASVSLRGALLATKQSCKEIASLHCVPLAMTQDVKKKFQNEPTINVVQQIAIAYAEVHPEKIKNWRKSAARRAVLPKVAVGLDRSDTNLLHWDTGSSPDTLLKGKDFMNWDVSFSWDLGELVWNPDQTSIDSRSKLLVELRESVLDQVTRLYFERRRIQIELVQLNLDEVSRLDKELRLAELTALIDGFTGGKFSQMIKGNENS